MNGLLPEEQSPRSRAVPGRILLSFNLAAVVFGATMLGWGIHELHHEGERWGLVGVMLLGGVGMLVQFVLLTLTVLAGGRPALRIRLASLLSILLAILLDGASLGCAFYEPYRHERAFIQKSAMYQSGLREAVLSRDVTRARGILEANPDVISETDYEGYSSLLLAVRGGDQSMVEMLIARGASPHSGHWDGTMPLHVAADRNAVEIARLLLDKGARVNQEDHFGKTALARAKAADAQAMIALLAGRGGTDVDYGDQLVKAVENGDAQLVTQLLDQGLKIDTSVPNGHCLLDYAAEKGNLKMAKLLISRGASVKRTDQYGRTALHWASAEGKAEMVGFLIDHRAEVDAKEHEEMTPLHEAVYWAQWHEADSLETIKVLVQRGADPNARNKSGMSVPQWAEKYGTDQIRAYLGGRAILKPPSAPADE
jgi:ankyrin repeat protein